MEPPSQLRTLALIEAVHDNRTDDIKELLRSHITLNTAHDYELMMRDILGLLMDTAGLASATISVLALEEGVERADLIASLRAGALKGGAT